jgi:hypothetical protein
MKITNKLMMVTLETDVTIGNNNAIELTLIHQACIFRDKLGGVDVDFDLIDFINIKFLGMDIKDGWDGWKDFKTKMLELGIDVNDLINKKCNEIESEQTIKNLKLVFEDHI